MAEDEDRSRSRRIAGLMLSVLIVLSTVLAVALVVYRTNRFPQTDDAEVFANYIGIAPVVEGPILHLAVRDNQFVRKGDLLFEIDERPYKYALQQALAEQATLEGQITDLRRTISAQKAGVTSSQAATRSAEANVSRMSAAVSEARAGVERARASVVQTRAEYDYANNNLHRLEPLLARQFVTVDEVDQARSATKARREAMNQAQSQLALAEAALQSALASEKQAQVNVEQSNAEVQRSVHTVTTLDPLIAQRESRASAVLRARYNVEHCRVYAPFDARVTNLTLSEGAYAHIGAQVFTLIDTRTWWVIANFRETQLRRVQPGMHADVYVMSHATEPLAGVVDSVGYGVTPDEALVGSLGPGLPNVQRSLAWVHLASRYPVRVRVTSPPLDLLRIGQSAVVVLRGDASEGAR